MALYLPLCTATRRIPDDKRLHLHVPLGGNDQLSRISRRGGECALAAVARRFAAALWTHLPTLWALVGVPLAPPAPDPAAAAAGAAAAAAPAAVASLHILRVIAPSLSPALLPSVVPLLQHVCYWARSADPWVRRAATRLVSDEAKTTTGYIAAERVDWLPTHVQ